MKKKEIMEIIKPISGFLPDEKTEGCPDPELLAAYVDDTLPAKDRSDLREHLNNCEVCAAHILSVTDRKDRPKKESTQWGFLRKFWTETRSWNLKTIPVLASVLAVVIIGTFMVFKFAPRAPHSTHLRNQGQGEIRLLSPKGTVSFSSLFFQWDPVPGAKNYVVEIRDIELNPVWESPELTDIDLRLPQNILSRLVKGQTYFWRITAVLSNGLNKVSPTLNFSVE